MAPMTDLLDHGRTELLVKWLREIVAEHAPTQPGLAEEISKQADYLAGPSSEYASSQSRMFRTANPKLQQIAVSDRVQDQSMNDIARSTPMEIRPV